MKFLHKFLVRDKADDARQKNIDKQIILLKEDLKIVLEKLQERASEGNYRYTTTLGIEKYNFLTKKIVANTISEFTNINCRIRFIIGLFIKLEFSW